MQGHGLMANHISTAQPLNLSNIAVPTYSVQKTGEYWSQTNKTTGDMTIHPFHMNAAIFPEIGKPPRVKSPNEGDRQTQMDKSIFK